MQINNMKYLVILIFTLLYTLDLFGQPDTIVMYNVKDQTLQLIPPVDYDSTLVFENTSFSQGVLPGKVQLNLEVPSSNILEGTQFTDIARAELFFDVCAYPVRTAVKLFGWDNDTLRHNCSGTMISENLVLTSAYCLFQNNKWAEDSILVIPAYDNGVYKEGIHSSPVDKIYLFKTFYDNKSWDDFALLELRRPIGFETGWQGIAYSKDTKFFTEYVFHKFSYPGVPSPFDRTRIYNGDTLYYNYGKIDYFPNFNPEAIGVVNGRSLSIPGKAGSSLFYTDNNEYYTFGVFNWAQRYRHSLINQNVFHQLKNIIDNYAKYENEGLDESYPLLVYPNPATDRVTLEFYNPDNQDLTLSILDLQGREVRNIKNILGERYYLDRNGLPAGMYFIRMYDDRRVFATKLVFK